MIRASKAFIYEAVLFSVCKSIKDCKCTKLRVGR